MSAQPKAPALQPVDVLAVMQRASERIADLSGGNKTATEAELQEARAIVADLIEAVTEVADYSRRPLFDRLRRALKAVRP